MRFSKTLMVAVAINLWSWAAHAQLNNLAPTELRNVETGLFIDVRRGIFEPEIPLWTYTGNTTDAQVFYPNITSDGDLHRLRASHPIDGPRLWVTIIEVDTRGIVVQEGDSAPERYRIVLRSEIEPPTEAQDSPFGVDQVLPLAGNLPMRAVPQHQQWRFTPVDAADGLFSIHPAAFPDFALTATGSEPGSPLLLRSYSGSATQHWHVDSLRLDPPDNVALTDFRYFPPGKLRGDISWTADSQRVDGFQVFAQPQNPALQEQSSELLSRAAREWEIDFEPGREARDEEWCFSVEARDRRAGRDIRERSQWVCEVARRNAPLPPPTTKYSRVIIENCHPDRITVRVWTSVNQGAWQDKGQLSHQYSASGICPQIGSPQTIDLADDTFTSIVAMHPDCGSQSPGTAQATCRVLDSAPYPGDESSDNVDRIQLGSGRL
ncbi:MAG: hypothetical protein AAF270_15930 [Pseudomonadota bacterium]